MWGLTATSAKDAYSLSNFLLQIFFMLHFKHVWAPYVELGNVYQQAKGIFICWTAIPSTIFPV